MDPFVRRLVQRLHDASAPLSRNRHFHTFDTPEGRLALKVSRRLRSLRKDILACHAEGARARVMHTPVDGEETKARIELHFERVRGRRVSHLQPAEYELLQEMPGVKEALCVDGEPTGQTH